MAKIIRVEKELLPDVKLVGKRYSDADRDGHGMFTGKWEEWFRHGYFEALEQGGMKKVSDDYFGAMRCTKDGFEYWIGILMSPGDAVPEGYASVCIPHGELGVCYVYGKDGTAELFGKDVHDSCFRKFREEGWNVPEDTWFFERYNYPRYTCTDESGNVILDYCACLG